MRLTLSKKVVAALNQQVNNEFAAAYKYLALAALFEDMNLPGFANWMYVQREEENAHAMRLFNFLQEHGAKIQLHNIELPHMHFENVVDVLEFVLDHEHKITQQVFKLYELAMEEKAYTVKIEMEWFISEQAEEENVVSGVLERARMVANDPAGILVLDNELAQRTFDPIAEGAA